MERRQEQGIDVDGPLDAETVRHQQSAAGPAMLFLELKPKPEAEGGGAYSEEELADLSGAWKDLLFSGGLEVSFYNIEAGRVLVSLKKGWDGSRVRDFLLDQKEAAKVTWDSHDYYPSDQEEANGGGSWGQREKGPKKKKKTTRKVGRKQTKKEIA